MKEVRITEVGEHEHWYTGELYCLPTGECRKFIDKGGEGSCVTTHNVIWVQARNYYET